MKQNHKLRQQLFFGILVIGVFLQSCNTPQQLPNQIEEQEIEGQKRSRERIRLQQREDDPAMVDLMPELWQHIFYYLDFEGVLAARVVSTSFNELITDSKQVGLVGVENKPHPIINTANWVMNKKIDFRRAHLSQITPETIPSFAFYHLMGHVTNLPKEFWPYLPGSSVHTLL